MAEIKSELLQNVQPTYDFIDDRVEMTVYPRVHMFGLDLSMRDGGIPSGSLGASVIDQPITISVKPTSSKDYNRSTYEGDFKIVDMLQAVRDRTQSSSYWDVSINHPGILRSHTGLGTSTQILGGVALCAAKSSGINLDYIDLFKMGFGHASTLGLSLLYEPGFILERGYQPAGETSGIILHPKLGTGPELPTGSLLKVENSPWYMILGIPITGASLSGEIEDNFWNDLLPDDPMSAQRTMEIVGSDIVPAIIQDDFAQFIDGMTVAASQRTKIAEEKIQSPQTANALHRIRESLQFGAVSSLGPTIYSFSESDPRSVLADLRAPDYEFRAVALGGLQKGAPGHGKTA